MRTKTFSAKSLLSLLLTVAMFATMILPTSVFAAITAPTATATVIESAPETQIKTITISFAEKVVLDPSAILDTDISVAGKTFGSSTMVLDPATQKDLVITLKDDADVAVGEMITFANDKIINANDNTDFFNGDIKITGSLDCATIDYSGIVPVGADIVVAGYSSAPMSVGTGTFNYTLTKDNYVTKTGSFVIEQDDLGTTVTVSDTMEKNGADYSALDAAIASASAYDADDYTATSFDALTTALTNANAVDRNLKFDEQATIDNLKTAIDAAISGLVSKRTVDFMAVGVTDDVNANYGKATKVVIVFDEPIDATASTVLDNLSIKDKVSSATWADAENTVLSLTLNADANLSNSTSITYTANDAVKTKLLPAVVDTKTVVALGNFAGSANLVTATEMAATIVKASTKPGVVKDDKIVFVFNAPVKDKPAYIEFDAFKAYPLTGTDNTVYVITFNGGETVPTSFTYGTMNATPTGSFGQPVAPVVKKIIAVENSKDAHFTGDEIVVYFDRPTNHVEITPATALAKLGFEIDGNAQWTENNTVLTFKLVADSAVSNGMTINLDGLGIQDEHGTIDYDAEDLTLAGAFITATAPVVKKVVAIDNDGTANTKDDLIVVSFDKPTNGVTISSTQLENIVKKAGQGLGGDAVATWNTPINTELTIKIGDLATINDDVIINLGGLGIKDADGIEDYVGTNLDVEGSFGTTIAPKITRAIAFTQGTKHIIRVFFNTEVQPKDSTTMFIDVVGFDMGLAPEYDGDPGVWRHNGISYYDIVLGDNHQEFTTNTYSITFNGILVDIETEKAETVDATATIKGGFEQDIDPEILSFTAYSTDGSGVAKAGDRLVVVMNSETTKVTAAGLGEFTNIDSDHSGITWAYTLTGNETVSITSEFDFTIVSRGKTIAINDFALAGSFGYVVTPSLLSATAYSKKGTGIQQQGDELILVFDAAVSDVVLATSIAGTPVKVDDEGCVWKVVLGATPDVVIGTPINVTAKSVATGKDIAGLTTTIGGSFGKEITPNILSATAYSNDGSGVAQVGDKIVVVFNAPVKDVTSTNFGPGTTSDNYTFTFEITNTEGINLGATEIVCNATSIATNKVVTNLKHIIDGSFGNSVTPKILSATAVSNDGSGIAKENDRIIVVFNTPVEITANALGSLSHSDDKIVWTITLTTNPSAVVGVTNIEFENVKNIKTGIVTPTVSKVLGGSFGYSEMPLVKSVVLSENGGTEKITVVFDRKVTKPVLSDIQEFKDNNAHLGTNPATSWNTDGTVLTIVLDADATTTATVLDKNTGAYVSGDVLNIKGLGINSADTNEEVAGLENLSIAGSLVPVVTKAYVDDGTDAHNTGSIITVEFSSRTNGAGIDAIKAQTALYGTGVNAEWRDNNKKLVITMSNDHTMADNAYIVLNGLGIKDGFANAHSIVGQYKIDTTKLAKTTLKLKAFVRKGTADRPVNNEVVDFTTGLAGDQIVIVFSEPTNMVQNADAKANVALVNAEEKFSADDSHTAVWTDNRTITITLGTDAVVTSTSQIKVSGVTFANGTGILENGGVVTPEGQFDGRKYWVVNPTRTDANGRVRLTATINRADITLAAGTTPFVVCQAFKGETVLTINGIKISDGDSNDVTFDFDAKDLDKVKLFVFDGDYSDPDAAVSILAETVEK